MRTLYFAVAALCAVLGGCATAYQKTGLTGGYTERRIDDSTYYVNFAGNGYATGERVHTFFLYRCAELTLEKGFDYLLVLPDKKKASLDDTARKSRAMWYSDDDAGEMQPAYYITITTYTAQGTVRMYRTPLTYDVPWAIDARKLKQALQAYVDSNGKERAPDLRSLENEIGATHEAIVFSPADQVKIEPLDAADANMALRTGDEIIEQFNSNQMLLHILFNGRRTITGGTDGGKIELGFMVSPNGVLSQARVVSTTFKDYSFAEAVAHSLGDLRFKSRGAPMTRVASFTIEFRPNY